jgi:putative ABC transport system ATP-binding protein
MLYDIKNLTKTYGEGAAQICALNNINLNLTENKFIVILGASGSGKSTLINMLGCMDKPSGGKIIFDGQNIAAFSKSEMTKFRGSNIGFVFQSYNLLPDLTALENVEFSTELAGLPRSSAVEALEMVGLKERLNNFPAQLSGGEQQRVSIARAIAKKPNVLLCDEPTGALDFKTGIMVLEVLTKIQKESDTTVLFITHNQGIAKIADLVTTLKSGEIISVQNNDKPVSPSEVEW